ncbi:MAG TPA: alpha/beta hydrolase [Rhizomicrobium sp.]|jgi:acetyl esterase/lipase
MPNWQSAFSARLAHLVRTPGGGFGRDTALLRRRYDSLFARFETAPTGVTFEAGQAGPIKGEWVRPTGISPERMILYLHGGGFVAGSPLTHRALVARLCMAAQAAAFVPTYRLAPEFPFPAGLRDAVDTYRHFVQRGVAVRSIALAGDEAGGGLAFSLLHAIRNGGLPMPAACAALSPWVDLSLSGWSTLDNAKRDILLSWEMLFVSARHYLQKSSPADPYASPVFASFREFPPLMVHAGALEILRDDASRIGERAAEAGIPVSVEIYDRMGHLFQASPGIAEARISLDRLGQFIRTRTAEAAGQAPSSQAAGREF